MTVFDGDDPACPEVHRPSNEYVSDAELAADLHRYRNNKAGSIYRLLKELQERRVEVAKYKAWAASSDPSPVETPCDDGPTDGQLLDQLEEAFNNCENGYVEQDVALRKSLATLLVRYNHGADRRAQKTSRDPAILDRKVTVCSECLCACCWQGAFYCDNYRTAKVVEKTVRELKALGPKESPDYWFKSPDSGKVDQQALEEYRAAVTRPARHITAEERAALDRAFDASVTDVSEESKHG